MKRISLYSMLCTTILALLMTGCVSASTDKTQAATTPTPAQPSGELTPAALINGLVDIGGRKLMLHCTGQGSPTVILEAGSGDNSSTWMKVQSGADTSARVCSYDRANLGNSDAAQKPRTFLDMAHDLHTLLVNAHIDGPYILVGHSMGGMLVRVFTDQYPKDVVGMVLVDSAHPDMGIRLMAGLPPGSASEAQDIQVTRRYFASMSNSNGRSANEPEGVDMQTSNAQVRAAQPLGNLPIVVISRSPDNPQFDYIPASLPAEINPKLRKIWQDLQGELARLSSNSTRVIAAHAGHYIQREEPELVINAITKMVSEVQDKMEGSIPSTQPVDQAAHAPKILGVVDRKAEKQNGLLILHKDVVFTDPAGDAAYDTVRLVSIDPPGNFPVEGGFITASPEQQKSEAMDPQAVGCPSKPTTFEIEVRIVDQAGNESEPVLLAFNCAASPKNASPLLIIGLTLGMGLLVGAWLLISHRLSGKKGALQTTHLPTTQEVGYEMKAFEARNLVFFFLIAFGMNWFRDALIIFGILKAPSETAFPAILPWILMDVLFGSGPLVGAFVMAAITEGKAGVKALWNRFWNRNIRIKWLLVILLTFPLLELAANLFARTLDGQAYLFLIPNSPWMVIYGFVQAFIFNGLLEEFGWRGYALPRFQARWSALTSSILLGIIWAAWHIPSFFIQGRSLYQVNFWTWAPNIILLSVIYTWIFNNTKGSVLAVALFHAATNASIIVLPSIMSYYVVLVLAIAIIVVFNHSKNLVRPYN
jgi:pimeloyl-ACP methyl ester carboxylesterase/membrane protease YdiL (CAAX protease family)